MDLKAHLQQTFHLSQFRPPQEEIITALLNKQDVFAILPTGSGKSLCYQFPATVFPGLTVVVSPLLSLMQDQLGKLTDHNIPSACWNSQQTQRQVNAVKKALLNKTIKILFLSPEKLSSAEVRSYLAKTEVSFLCVDEAHCISQWGHDFRPEYLHIGEFIHSLPQRPVVAAFTATATAVTAKEITRQLQLLQPRNFALPAYRPNLKFSVESVPSEAVKRSALFSLVRWWQSDLWGSAIVYAATRQETELLVELLHSYGFPQVAAYHAGLDHRLRRQILRKFLTQPRALLVATSAFGMGVDKPNVRLVIHHSPPTSLEAYIQESGRAGRDGLESWCIMLYNRQDLERNFSFTSSTAQAGRRNHLRRLAHQVARFAENHRCFSRQLAAYLSPSGESGECLGCGCTYCSPQRPWVKPTGNNPPPELFAQLRSLRQQKAKVLKIPPYFLGTDTTLVRLAIQQPTTWLQLKELSGMGYTRLRYWGKEIIALVRAYSSSVRTSGPS